MTGPIRTLLYAPQATAGTRPTNMMNMRITVDNEPDMRDIFERQFVEVHDGTVEGDEDEAGGARHTEITVNVPLYYDTGPWWLVTALGAPVSTANVAPDAVVFDHVFKRATATAPVGAAFEFYDNIRWRQCLDMVCSDAKITQGNNGVPMLGLTYMGPEASDITEPTVPAGVSAYQPASWNQLVGDIGGTASDIMSYTLDFPNNRNPRYNANATASATRYTRGLQTATLDSVHDYLAYAGSPKETYDQGNDIANWHAIYTAGNVDIGTTPLHPRITIFLPKVLLGTMELPTTNSEKTQHYTARAGKDSGIASRAELTFRSLVTAYAPS